MLLALQQPFWMLNKWGSDTLPLALVFLALQAAAYALWFLALRPWIIRRLDGVENAQETRMVMYIFCVLFLCEAQELLAYCAHPPEAPARLTLVFLIAILLSAWLALFFANDSPQRLLFHIDGDGQADAADGLRPRVRHPLPCGTGRGTCRSHRVFRLFSGSRACHGV